MPVWFFFFFLFHRQVSTGETDCLGGLFRWIHQLKKMLMHPLKFISTLEFDLESLHGIASLSTEQAST